MHCNVKTRCEALKALAQKKLGTDDPAVVEITRGGKNRSHHVLRRSDMKKVGLIAVHDGARPLVSQRIITETIYLAAKTGAAAPAVPVRDTIRVVEGGLGVETPERTKLYAMQTPQIFGYQQIRGAYDRLQKLDKTGITDDAMVMEKLGNQRVHMFPGDYTNIKITTPDDLEVAEQFLKPKKF